MPRLIDARDVLDPDGKIARFFRGRVLGAYRPTGTGPFAPYRYEGGDEGVIDVLPGLKIQMEERGPRFRMRHTGRVLRVEWEPEPGDRDALESDAPSARRAYFLARFIELFDEAAGRGAAAVIATKLRE